MLTHSTLDVCACASTEFSAVPGQLIRISVNTSVGCDEGRSCWSIALCCVELMELTELTSKGYWIRKLCSLQSYLMVLALSVLLFARLKNNSVLCLFPFDLGSSVST